MKKLLLSLLLISSLAYSQAWERQIPDPLMTGWDSILRVVGNPDGTVLTLTRHYLHKWDQSGNVLWWRNVYTQYAGSLSISPFGTIIATGPQSVFEYDQSGNLLDSINCSPHFNMWGDLIYVEKLADSSYIICGTNDLFNTWSSLGFTKWIHLDAQHLLLDTLTMDSVTIVSGTRLRNGTLVFTGWFENFCIDSTLNIVWRKPIPTNWMFYGAQRTLTTSSDGFWMHGGKKFDNNGDTLYSIPAFGYAAYDQGDRFIMAADTSQSTNDVWIYCTDTTGNMIWSNSFFKPLTWDQSNDIALLPSNRYAIAACVYQGPSFLIVTDSMGHLLPNHVKGSAWRETITDCFKMNNEYGYDYWVVEATGSNGNFYCLTDTAGYYDLTCDTGIYSVQIPNPAPFRTLYCPVPSNYTLIMPQPYTTVTGRNFAYVDVPNQHDFGVEVMHYPRLNPVMNLSYYTMKVTNWGTTADSATVAFQPLISAFSQYIYCYSNPDSVQTNTFYYSTGTIPPLQSVTLCLGVALNPNMPLNSIVQVQATLLPNFTDQISSNNIFLRTDTVTSAYDPNFKEVLPAGTGLQHFISNSDTLRYTIHFQNTGNDTAYTVVIRDTIDGDLDLGTLRIHGASHTFYPVLTENKVLEFHFNNILLPDSGTNQLASHGFVEFSIKPYWWKPVNTLLTNAANIYFDWNPPIRTNTTWNTIGSLSELSPVIRNDAFTIFPNPNSGLFSINLIEFTGKETIEILDLQGRSVVILTATGKEQTIDLGSRAPGFYLVRVTDKHQVSFVSRILIVH